MQKLKLLNKYLVLFFIGFFSYIGIEILWRGYSHWTMGILSGSSLIFIGGLNNWFPWEMPIWEQMGIGAIFITGIEFIAGVILNIWLQLNIWDYSSLSFNIMGQISLSFTIAWFFLSGVAIIVDDYLRYFLFHEEYPHYTLKRGE